MKVKKMSLILLSLSFFLLPFQEFVSASETFDQNDMEEEGVEVLDGQERMDYLKLLENDSLFNEKVSSEDIAKDTSQVMHMTPTVEDSEIDEFILVTGTIENSKKYGFYAIIDMDTDEVKRITNMEFDHANEYVNFYDYNYDGTLVLDTEVSFEELENGDGLEKLENDQNQTLADDPPSNPKDKWWFSWACNFSGVVACSAGCVAFIPLGPAYGVCTTACTFFWGSGLC